MPPEVAQNHQICAQLATSIAEVIIAPNGPTVPSGPKGKLSFGNHSLTANDNGPDRGWPGMRDCGDCGVVVAEILLGIALSVVDGELVVGDDELDLALT